MGAALQLAPLARDELCRAAPDGAQRLAGEIRHRCGDTTAAVLFYGSCLRRQTQEGVLDFYVLVDSIHAASPSRGLAWVGALLPPNVFYLELEAPEGTLRAKYAVMTTADFTRATEGRCLRTGFWARFSQPALAVYCRDPAARELVVHAAAAAVRTAVRRMLPLLPAENGVHRFTPQKLWQCIFRETYAGEMRTESPETVAQIYSSAPERYEQAAHAALTELREHGWAASGPEDYKGNGSEAAVMQITLPNATRRRARLAWRVRRPLAKLAYVAQLLKTALTFADWLPYVLWKIERHTGTRIVPTQRQRRHPLIYGWPILVRILRRGDLR